MLCSHSRLNLFLNHITSWAPAFSESIVHLVQISLAILPMMNVYNAQQLTQVYNIIMIATVFQITTT